MATTDSATTSTSNPFDDLPIETVQHIGSFCTYDSDLCHFRLICRSTLDAVDADNCSFWRRRFLDTFEASAVLKAGGESDRVNGGSDGCWW